MRVVAFDTETHLFGPGNMAPKPVCLTYQDSDKEGIITGAKIRDWFFEQVKTRFVGHNVAYDFAVVGNQFPDLMPYIFEWYKSNRVEDTMLREKLLDIAEGALHGAYDPKTHKWVERRYGLAAVVKRYFGTDIELDKGEDGWRLRYAELDGVPVSEWPERAREYAIDDASWTLAVYGAQQDRARKMRYDLEDSFAQARGAFALHLASVWGIVTDGRKIEKLSGDLAALREEAGKILAANGMYDIEKDKKNSKRLREWVGLKLGSAAPRTEKGAIKTDKGTLATIDDPLVNTWVEFVGYEKIESTYLKNLRVGAYQPIHTRFDSLIATGRTSSSAPNIQNMPRKPTTVREVVVPRKGMVFINCDYDSQEMRTLAQTLVIVTGRSQLAERYKADRHFDPHSMLAGTELNLNYEQAMERKAEGDEEFMNRRQQAKIPNFGLPGGMGVKGLVNYAWNSYGVRLSEERAAEMRTNWFKTWPEMEKYFEHIRSCVGRANAGTITIPKTGRRRGMCGYTDGANTYFQGGASDISKAALFEASARCYTQPSSALYGCRVVNFIHDELMLEAPEDRAAEAARELEVLMVRVMEEYTPDVPAAATAALSRFWSKNAEPVYDENGRLTVWEG